MSRDLLRLYRRAVPSRLQGILSSGTPPGRRLPAYYLYLAAILGLYVLLYGTLLAMTRGIPYVTDGNESFSMLLHASNMSTFPISDSVGLSDEAMSPDPAAHPYVYTHQGNFPRLFALVLYALGAQSVESQIVITTFTVGMLSVVLMYHYLSTIASVGFAALAVLVFLTDYLLFAQWQVNTYRVWHGLFFFLALLCVEGAGGPRGRRWLVLTAVSFACLFYFELAFATFVAVMAALHAGVLYRTRLRLLLSCWCAQGLGTLLGAAALIAQLVAYFGWADFLLDLQLTYSARNLLAEDPAAVERVRAFVESRHVAFWYNFAGADHQRSLLEILSSITRGYFSVYTPTLWYLVTIVTTGWLVALLNRRYAGRSYSSLSGTVTTQTPLFPVIAAIALILSATRCILALVQDRALVGIGELRLVADFGRMPWVTAAAAGMLAGAAGVAARLATGRWPDPRRWPAGRTATAAAMLLFTEYLLMNSGSLFEQAYIPLWLHIEDTWSAGWIVRLAIVVAVALAVWLCFGSPVSDDLRWPSMVRYLGCGTAAYAIVYILSPGYLQSGYLKRWVPFASFVFAMAIAVTMYAAWRAAVHLCRAAWRVFRSQRQATLSAAVRLAASACAFPLLLFPVFFWTALQAQYVALLPATHFDFMQQLREPPFLGASFAANTYAAPMFLYTGQWAYFDTKLGRDDGAAVTVTGNGYAVVRDASTYLWLADRETNPDYLRPKYFLCVKYQDLSSAVKRLTGRAEGCSSTGAVRRAVEREQPSVAGRLVARDPTDRDSWAIVELDWSVLDEAAAPPFVKKGSE